LRPKSSNPGFTQAHLVAPFVEAGGYPVEDEFISNRGVVDLRVRRRRFGSRENLQADVDSGLLEIAVEFGGVICFQPITLSQRHQNGAPDSLRDAMGPQFRKLVLDRFLIIATGHPPQQKRPLVQIPNAAVANGGAEPMVQACCP